MENYRDGLLLQLEEIDALIAKTNRDLYKMKDLPRLRIGVSISNGNDQYYILDKDTNKRKYVKANEIDKLKKIAQRDYEESLNRKLKKSKKQLERFLRQYNVEELDVTYKKRSSARRKLIKTIIDTEEMFLQKWNNVEYEPMGFEDNQSIFVSDNGIRVRSKSELIIANLLEKKNIPYRYEYPINLQGLGVVRPDFYCLNVRTRKEFVWEHFGMMDNSVYADKNVSKIDFYEQNGFFAGKKMIMTFETSSHPISSVIIKSMVEQYLI